VLIWRVSNGIGDPKQAQVIMKQRVAAHAAAVSESNVAKSLNAITMLPGCTNGIKRVYAVFHAIGRLRRWSGGLHVD